MTDARDLIDDDGGVVEVNADDEVGRDPFNEDVFYALPRGMRKELSDVWAEVGDGALLGQRVGRVEDVLWEARKYSLARHVVATARARRERAHAMAGSFVQGLLASIVARIPTHGDDEAEPVVEEATPAGEGRDLMAELKKSLNVPDAEAAS